MALYDRAKNLLYLPKMRGPESQVDREVFGVWRVEQHGRNSVRGEKSEVRGW